MPGTVECTYEMEKSTLSQVMFWAEKLGLSEERAINHFLRLGIANYEAHSRLGYLDWCARETAHFEREMEERWLKEECQNAVGT